MNRFKYPQVDIAKAIRFLKKKKGQPPNFITKFPGQFKAKHGKLYAGNLLVISTEQKEEYLRKVVYGKKSEYPFGRDSLFLILKDEVLGVSKRDIEAFLNKQGPLVHRRSRPKKETRENLRQIRKPGILSVDLAHIRAKDFEPILGQGTGLDYMGARGKRGYQQDRYFLNGVDLLTGYLVTEVLQGKTARETWPKLQKIIKTYETKFKIKVRQLEFDKGGEFYGDKARPNKEHPEKSLPKLSIAEELKKRPEGPIRVIRKITNAAVEQTNAKMQRIFWALVEQRRGGFQTTWKQAVRISNRTRSRRTGMTPDEAMKKLAAGEQVLKKKPKARATERKKAWKVGDNVRALKRPRAKAELKGYKAYKGQHFGAVTPITAVKFMGVWPKYKVGARWVWQDEIIKARPEDTRSHNLYIKRPVILPDKMIPKPKPKPKKAGPVKFYKWQDIWVTKYGKRFGAKIISLEADDKLKIEYWWEPEDTVYKDTISKGEAKAMRTYELEDRIQMKDRDDGKWYDAEVDKHAAKGNYRVFFVSNNRKYSRILSGAWLRPRP